MQDTTSSRLPPRPLQILRTFKQEKRERRQETATQKLRERALLPGEQRDRLFLEHPIVVDRAYFVTSPIRGSYEQLVTCLTHRDSCRCFVGAPRCGKSHAIEVLRAALSNVFTNLPIISINAKGHDAHTEKAFFGDLLDDVGLKFESQTTAFTRRQRFKQYIKTICSREDSSVVMAFVDEAQSWDEEEFTFLRDLANDLIKFDSITLIVVLLAQSKIVLTRSKLSAADRIDLVGRYLRDPISLFGLQTLSELEDVLGQCDDALAHEYPDYSGICYSEFFLRRAYGSGWRLRSEGAAFWGHLLEEIGARPGEQVSIGMAWVMSALRDFLFQATPVDSEDFASSDSMWEAAAKCGRYSTLMRAI